MYEILDKHSIQKTTQKDICIKATDFRHFINYSFREVKTIGLHIHPNQSVFPSVCQDRLRDRRQTAAGGAEPQHGGAVCVPRLRYI